MNDYRVLVRNKQGATELKLCAPTRKAAAGCLRTYWSDPSELQVEVYNDLGRCIGTKNFGVKRITWIGY